MWRWINSINIWWFYITKFFKSPLAYIGIFVLPLIFIVGLGSILHTTGIFVETIGFSLLFIEAITFGSTYFSMKKSTLTYNSKLSNMRNSEINFAVFLLMIVVGFFTLVYAVTIFFLIEHYTNILIDIYIWDAMSPFSKVKDLDVTETIKIRWLDVSFWAILYYGFLYTFVMYGLSILFTAFTKTQKTFFIMIFTFIAFTLIFGGVMSTMFGASSQNNVPVVPTENIPLVMSPWGKPTLNLNQNAWTTYVSFLNPLYWVNEWGFFLFGNHSYYNIEFNEEIIFNSEWIIDNFTEDYDVYFRIHEGTFLASKVSSDLWEKNLYQLNYSAVEGAQTFTLYNYSILIENSNDPAAIVATWSVNDSESILYNLNIIIPAGYVFSIKEIQSLSPNLIYFKWSETWQYNASIILPYVFVVIFEILTIIINWQKKWKYCW